MFSTKRPRAVNGTFLGSQCNAYQDTCDTIFGAKLMRPELRDEMLRILEALANGDWRAAVRNFGMPLLTLEAIDFLEESGTIGMKGNRPFITTTGYDHLKASQRPWLKVLTNLPTPITVLAALIASVVGVVTLLRWLT